MKTRKTLKKVAAFISENSLLSEGARIVVGLSGGPDSVCLALLLYHLNYEIVAVHCNFHLRGDESMRDEKFVEDLCHQYNWTYYKADFNTQEYAQAHAMSIEMAARDLRYEYFRHIKKEVNAEVIAVGHHQDDNAETLLLNLVRGTGIRGLCAMQFKHGDIVRPLLCLSHQEILDYLHEEQQDYVTDHTNLEDEYARNKIRLNVLPTLREVNKGASKNILSTIENLNEVLKVYQQATQQAIADCCTQRPKGELAINIELLQQQPSPISVLHEILSPLGFNKTQLKEMLSTRTESGRFFVGRDRRVLIDRQNIIVEAPPSPFPTIRQEIVPIEQLTILKDSNHAYLDADKIKGKLMLRCPKVGDTFAPFGMKGKRKLLSDFLTDQKLNCFEKERQPLLVDGEEIAWVVGLRSSELYRVGTKTSRVLCLSIQPT